LDAPKQDLKAIILQTHEQTSKPHKSRRPSGSKKFLWWRSPPAADANGRGRHAKGGSAKVDLIPARSQTVSNKRRNETTVAPIVQNGFRLRSAEGRVSAPCTLRDGKPWREFANSPH